MVGPTIVLAGEEMLRARLVAQQLHSTLRALGVPDAHGAKPEDITPEIEAVAAAAELATAKLFGVPWTASLPGASRDGPDIGRRTQVRCPKRPGLRLIVREWDIAKYGDVPFVLVYREGCRFTFPGWLMSHEARQVGQWTDAGRSDRGRAWFIDQRKLRPIKSLEDL
jgi:hypothetical protein